MNSNEASPEAGEQRVRVPGRHFHYQRTCNEASPQTAEFTTGGRYANLRYWSAAVRPLRQLLKPSGKTCFISPEHGFRRCLTSMRQNAVVRGAGATCGERVQGSTCPVASRTTFGGGRQMPSSCLHFALRTSHFAPRRQSS